MSRNNRVAALLVAISAAAFSALPASDAIAQEKRLVKYSVSAQNTKYTRQHVIDVGDAHGHQVRIYEIHRTFPKDPPVIEGLKITEAWTRAWSDFTNGNGLSVGYTSFTMENGDRFHVKWDLVGQAATSSSGDKRNRAAVVGVVTGGTGKLLGMRGIYRNSVRSDIAAGINETETDLEYWMEK